MRKITLLLAALVLFSTSFAQSTTEMLTSVKSKSLLMPMNGAKTVVDTLHYDAKNDDGIGTGAAADFGVYAKHPVSVMTPLVGKFITEVEIYINGVTDVSAVEVRLYNDTLTPVLTQTATGLVEGWNTVKLIPSYPITAADLIVGYNVTCTGGYPSGVDAGPREPSGNGDIMYFGKWTTLNALSSSLNANWNIRAIVDNTTSIKSSTANTVDVAIYPNPANALLNIKSDSKIVNVRIFNIIGQIVMVEKLNVTHAVLEIDDLDEGMYYVEVETESGIKVKTLAITR